jgi:adenylate cyclase class 2
MTFEVELKFAVDDHRSLIRSLQPFKPKQHEAIRQVDRYFNHPSRDFGQTTDALRIRSTGDETRVTYKGPLVDDIAKTRREIDLRLVDSSEEPLNEMFTLLGFREVRSVVKSRTCLRLHFEGREIEVALDDVDGLGRFVELECITDEAGKNSARDCLLRLADQLSLRDSTRRSYLEMLIEKDSD